MKNCSQDILCEEKSLFSIKGKKKNHFANELLALLYIVCAIIITFWNINKTENFLLENSNFGHLV